MAALRPPLTVKTWTRYNPAGRSALFMVPGLAAYILAISAVLLTALTVAGEWERGSMEQLFASPVSRLEIVLGKLLPYLAIGMLQLLLVLAVGSTLFDVPLRGSLLAVFAAGLVHVIPALGQLRAARAGFLGIDAITGGFGSGTANLMGYFCGTIVIVSLCLGLIARERRQWLLAAPIGFVWPLTSANGSYVAFALVSVFALFVSAQLRRFRKLFAYGVIAAIIALGIGYSVRTRFQLSFVDSVFSPVKNLVGHRIDPSGNPGRVALMQDTAALLGESDRHLFWGFGTGSVGTLLGPGLVPSNFRYFSDRTRATFVSASVIVYFAELGLVGLAVMLAIWVTMFVVVWHARRFARDRPARAWLLAAVLLVPFMFLAGCGEVTWTFQPVAYCVWSMAAYATTLIAGVRREART